MRDQAMTEHDSTTARAGAYDKQPVAVSPWAIVSFALAVVALFLFASFGGIVALLAVIAGHGARHDIKRGLKAGRNWALSGLILGYFVLLLAAVAAIADR